MVAWIFLGAKDDDGLSWKVAQYAVDVLKDRFQTQQVSSEGLSHNNGWDGVDIVGSGYSDDPVFDLVSDLLVIVDQPVVSQPDRVDVVISLSEFRLSFLIYLDWWGGGPCLSVDPALDGLVSC